MKTSVNIDKVIAELMPYDKLPRHKKKTYYEFVSHPSKNPRLLDAHNATLDNQKRQGGFITKFLQFLLHRRDLEAEAKENIGQLLPHVPLTGPGARQLPAFFTESSRDGPL